MPFRPAFKAAFQPVYQPSFGDGGVTGLLDLYSGAAAAYSLRALSSGWFAGDVVEVRRSSDSTSQGFTANQIARGAMVDWVNETIELPLDFATGAAAAYSLRNLSTSYSGNVVEVRRSSDSTSQGFTASQTTSGAMLDFVNGGTTDLYNSARYFNGTSTEVTIPDSPDFTISTSIDVSADVLLTSNTAVGIVNKGIGTIGNREWSLTINVSNQLEFIVFDESLSINIKASTTDFPTNELFTARGYYDGSDIYIYVNGVQKATTAGVIAIENLAADIQIGNTLAPSRRLHGIVSNVSILVDGTGVAAYSGLGTSVTAWQDTINSNNGTETNGAAYTGQPFDGFVSTWYDQSGNTNHATQAAPASQPKIVSAGALVAGGLNFDGVDDRLTCSSMYSADLSVFATATTNNTVNTANYMRMLHICDGADSFQITRGGGVDIGLLCSKNTSFQAGIDAFKHGAINGENLITTITSAIETDAYVDGSLGSNSATDLGSGNSAITTIGARDDLSASTFFAGSFAELIVYASDQSAKRAGIESNIATEYGITLPSGSNAGSIDGFVSTWYDQSGNAKHATQITNTFQPKIVSVGALILDDQGNATIKFDGIDDFLDCGARVVELSANAATVFGVSQKDGGALSQTGYTCSEGDAFNPYSSNFILSSTQGNEVLWLNGTTFGISGAGLRLESFLYDQVNVQAYLNGATSGAAGAATVNAEITNTIIGASGDGITANSARKITALISYKSNQSANIAGIHSAINDLYTIY